MRKTTTTAAIAIAAAALMSPLAFAQTEVQQPQAETPSAQSENAQGGMGGMGGMMQGMQEQQTPSMGQGMMMGRGMCPGMMGGGMGSGMMGGSGKGFQMMPMMMALVDTDESGTLSLDEVQAVHARMFRMADTDEDGELSPKEIAGFMHPGRPAAE